MSDNKDRNLPSRLKSGAKNAITSQNKQCRLQLNRNGNLAVLRYIDEEMGFVTAWFTGRLGLAVGILDYEMVLQRNGNLVTLQRDINETDNSIISGSGVPVFSTDTATDDGDRYHHSLVFDEDCRLKLYRNETELLWTNIIQHPFESGRHLQRTQLFSMSTPENGNFYLHLSPSCVVSKWDNARDLADRKAIPSSRYTFQSGPTLVPSGEDCHVMLGHRRVVLCRGKYDPDLVDDRTGECTTSFVSSIQNIWALSQFNAPRKLSDEQQHTNGLFTDYPFNLIGAGFEKGSSMRYQQVYAASNFDSMHHSFRIDAMTFFRLRNQGFGSVFHNTIVMKLSTTKRTPETLSPIFDENIGFHDETIVYNAKATHPRQSSIMSFSFQNEFIYNPANGNLLLDIQIKEAHTETSPFIGTLDFPNASSSVTAVEGVEEERGKVSSLVLRTLIEAPPVRYCLWLDGIGPGRYVFMNYTLCPP